MATIVYWRSREPDESGRSDEYIIMTDEKVTAKWVDENTRPGYSYMGKVEADIPHTWPLNYGMEKTG